MKKIAKLALHVLFLVLAFPFGLTAGFGRFPELFLAWGQLLALVPGVPGDYLRVAYYRLTLRSCHRESRIQFGSFFSRPEASVARLVYIGPYCVLGQASIGERTQIAASVQILSGRKQHARGSDGQILGSDEGVFSTVTIGADCWIGAQAIVMADIGPRTTIGAGAVILKAAPADAVVVGNPGRVVSVSGTSV